ncbi:hypothetical protein WELLINGTON_5 [Erwinia phage Wellington]|uniref:Uncharacterized protein n=1 Tax=Erwinia phage Wellington TaxID=2267653 RepID=A0A345BLV0_9CAUD|nr:hypothetical protein HOT70_gp005 [Erwinia phage Wellington]AXF51421.1 hypothetical protein WELLINGTON_5 [Erwinia phage Wellington]
MQVVSNSARGLMSLEPSPPITFLLALFPRCLAVPGRCSVAHSYSFASGNSIPSVIFKLWVKVAFVSESA